MNDRRKQGRRGGRTTIKQVAAELGVSAMTVSNAYNRPNQLSPALRERIFEAARRLGYAGPDPTARGLRRGRTGAVGVIYDTPLSYAVGDAAAVAFLRGVSEAAEREKLGLLLLPGFPGEARDASAARNAMVDGFVIYSVSEDDQLVLSTLERGLPVVVVDQPHLEGVPFVSVDDTSAARAAAEHLLGLGHRRFGVVSFGLRRDGRQGLADLERQRSSRYPVSRARLGGYTAALEGAGISWSNVPVFECQGSSQSLGLEAARTLLALPERPTAILATSDRLAVGVVKAANEAGISVPGDLSVVGFDDTLEAASSKPPLTSVAQDHTEKGRLAGQLLVAGLRGERPVSLEPLPTRLVVRGSSAPVNQE
jgi:DNA-binding LacI/PurR family transcriptional regulator